jgi:hypothetical protein
MIKRLSLLIMAALFTVSGLGAVANAQANGIVRSVCEGASAAAGSPTCYPSNTSNSSSRSTSNGTGGTSAPSTSTNSNSTGGTVYNNNNSSNSNGSTNNQSTSNRPSNTNLGNNSGIYAAMGDSVAAGLGLTGMSNANSNDTQCGRSSQGYPSLVAQQTGYRLVNVACSGATAGDLYTNQGVQGPNIGPQLDQAFRQGTPQLITITAGANDVHWDSFARACYATDCATSLNAGLARFYLTGLQSKLLKLL